MSYDFSHIIFDPATHTYTCDGQKLTGVTKYVAQFKKPFDANYWAEKKAQERGVPKELILQEWDEKRQQSQRRGEQIHAYIAQKLMGDSRHETDPFLSLNSKLPEMMAFETIWAKSRDSLQLEVCQVEWVIGDVKLKIAGTADTLLYSQKTGQYHLWDWKTGSKFTDKNRFQALLHPFNDLDECELNTYSLQLSLYRLILARNTELELGDSYLVYLNPMGDYVLYKALNLSERLEQWLLH